MADIYDIDDTDLDEFREAIDYFTKNFPRESRRVLGKVGTAAKKIAKAEAKQRVGKVSGNYYKSIKRGRVFCSGNDELTVRVFPSYKIAPHAHLIEKGHRIVRGSQELGWAPGKLVFEKAGHAIERDFHKIVEREMDKELSKI